MALVPGELVVAELTPTSITVTVVGASSSTPGLHPSGAYRFRHRVPPDAFEAWPVWVTSPSYSLTGLSPGVTYEIAHTTRTGDPVEAAAGTALTLTTPDVGTGLPGNVTAGVSTGHLSHHEKIHATMRVGQLSLTEGSAGHLDDHDQLKTQYDSEHGTKLPAVTDGVSHAQVHNMLHAWVNSAPAAPTHGTLQVTTDGGTKTATVTWVSATNSATGWRVARDGNDSKGNGAWSQVYTDPALRTSTLIDLIAGTPYNFVVTRLDDGYEYFGAATMPGADPTPGISFTNGHDFATVTWESANSPAGWRVARNGTDTHGAGPWSHVFADPGMRQTTFTRLIPQATYTFTITNMTTGEERSITVTQPAAPVVEPPPEGAVWQAKISAAPLGRTSSSTLSQIFGPTFATSSTAVANSEVVSDGGSKVLRQHIPANTLGTLIASPKLPTRLSDATISFDVRFDPGFAWRHGLKVGAGLVGIRPGAGIYDPTSGKSRDNGCSMRIMAHGSDGSTRPFQGALGPLPAGKDNEIVSYLYVRNPNAGFNGFGWHTGLGSFTRGVWHNIKFRGKLNTPGSGNGVIQMWVDGVLKYQNNSADFRGSNSQILWDAVLWDTHRGGGATSNWLSTRNDYLDLRNVIVTGV